MRTLTVLALLGVLSGLSHKAAAQTLAVQVSPQTVPAGATVQLQVSILNPAAVKAAQVTVSLDPAIFGPIIAVDALAANGDQTGIAALDGNSADIRFQSVDAGIGRVRDLPVLLITAPVLPYVPGGTSGIVSVSSLPNSWALSYTDRYSLAPAAATVTVVDPSSFFPTISEVSPQILGPGATGRLTGTFLSAASRLDIAGLSIASTRVVNSGTMEFTLNGNAAVDLRGKRFHISDTGGGSDAVFYGMTPAHYVKQLPFRGSGLLQPVYRTQLSSLFTFYPGVYYLDDPAIAVQNPTGAPVILEQRSYKYAAGQTPPDFQYLATLGPGESYIGIIPQLPQPNYDVRSSAPVRFQELLPQVFSTQTDSSSYLPSPPLTPSGTPQINMVVRSDSSELEAIAGSGWSESISLALQPASAADSIPFSLRLYKSTDDDWITPSSISGSAPASVSLNIHPPLTMPAGDYTAVVEVTPAVPNPVRAIQTITLHVRQSPALTVDQQSITLTSAAPSVTVALQTGNDDLPVSVATDASWLRATLSQNTTPATLTLTADVGGLRGGTYSAIVSLTGRDNIVQLPVTLQTGTQLYGYDRTLTASQGATAPATVTIDINPYGVTLPPNGTRIPGTTTDGGQWLSAILQNQNNSPRLVVNADPTGLKAGRYSGQLQIASLIYEIGLSVYDPAAAPAVQIYPASMTTVHATSISMYPAIPNSYASTGDFAITSGNTPLLCTVDPPPGLTGVSVYSRSGGPVITPAKVYLMQSERDWTTVAPGTYRDVYTFHCGQSTATFTWIHLVLPQALPVGTPQVFALVNAASQQFGAVAPGEIVTLFGDQMGAGGAPHTLSLAPDGKVVTESMTQRVLFDGIPAPLLYSTPGQINAVVPQEVSGKAFVKVTLEFNGVTADYGAVPVTDAAPAVFSAAGTGLGGGAVRNSDNSINSPDNAAARGSVIQVFATGEGLDTPAAATGEVTNPGTSAKPALPVSATIGGVPAAVQFAGPAPGAVHGLLQINLNVPASVAIGPTVPLTIQIGTHASAAGVTVAIK